MTIIIGLIVGAVILALGELVLPGGILGIFAFICICAATWFALEDYGLIAALGVFSGSTVLIISALFGSIKFLQKMGWSGGIFLNSRVEGHTTGPNRDAPKQELVGKHAEALTALAPTGMISVDGTRYEAYSQSGFLDKGTPCEITGVETYRVIVKSLS